MTILKAVFDGGVIRLLERAFQYSVSNRRLRRQVIGAYIRMEVGKAVGTSRVVRPGKTSRSILNEQGKEEAVPNDWELLPPGDAALTRRVKLAGPHWVVQEKKGRRTFSQGVWADQQVIEKHRDDLEKERSTDSYQKRKTQAANRRAKKQVEYEGEFAQAVYEFLSFSANYDPLAKQLAQVISDHAVPVGSGTVARTQRIPIEKRAEAAVIAWLRHQTTAYDDMKIERVRGRRREVRRELASQSRRLLDRYRRGVVVNESDCLLRQALNRLEQQK